MCKPEETLGSNNLKTFLTKKMTSLNPLMIQHIKKGYYEKRDDDGKGAPMMTMIKG